MRVLLKHRETRVTAAGTFCELSADHLCRARTSWVEEFGRRECAGRKDDDFILWERGLMSLTGSAKACPPGHVILRSDRIEGIVLTSREPESSRKAPTSPTLYVPYLATAPWNRDGQIPEQGFLGIGRLLVARAVLDSVSRGCGGRLALNSYPAARAFYGALGFVCLGTDSTHSGMMRFELLEDGVTTALAELGANLRQSLEVT